MTPYLHRLYLVRFAFALAWGLLLLTTAGHLGPLAAVLLVLYPVVDAAASYADARSSRGTATLYANIVVSLLAAVAIGLAATSGIPAVLRVWGVWAIGAGLAQLLVAVTRRRSGGQWPIIVSGAVSVLGGGTFLARAATDRPHLTTVAFYALTGGAFFLIAALRGRRGAPVRSGALGARPS